MVHISNPSISEAKEEGSGFSSRPERLSLKKKNPIKKEVLVWVVARELSDSSCFLDKICI
jgi:hypothetical protein